MNGTASTSNGTTVVTNLSVQLERRANNNNSNSRNGTMTSNGSQNVTSSGVNDITSGPVTMITVEGDVVADQLEKLQEEIGEEFE